MTSLEMITIQELLRDKQYREYFLKAPKLPEHYNRPGMLPWKLYIQKPGETIWRAKRFSTYRDAFEALKKLMKSGTVGNAAINCPPLAFIPPVRNVRLKGVIDKQTKKQAIQTIVWKPRIESDMADHLWCGHCRRPSIFRVAAVNINRKDAKYILPVGEPALRCSICGASERVINLRNPLTAQRWDPTRPYIAKRVA